MYMLTYLDWLWGTSCWEDMNHYVKLDKQVGCSLFCVGHVQLFNLKQRAGGNSAINLGKTDRLLFLLLFT